MPLQAVSSEDVKTAVMMIEKAQLAWHLASPHGKCWESSLQCLIANHNVALKKMQHNTVTVPEQRKHPTQRNKTFVSLGQKKGGGISTNSSSSTLTLLDLK